MLNSPLRDFGLAPRHALQFGHIGIGDSLISTMAGVCNKARREEDFYHVTGSGEATAAAIFFPASGGLIVTRAANFSPGVHSTLVI